MIYLTTHDGAHIGLALGCAEGDRREKGWGEVITASAAQGAVRR